MHCRLRLELSQAHAQLAEAQDRAAGCGSKALQQALDAAKLELSLFRAVWATSRPFTGGAYVAPQPDRREAVSAAGHIQWLKRACTATDPPLAMPRLLESCQANPPAAAVLAVKGFIGHAANLVHVPAAYSSRQELHVLFGSASIWQGRGDGEYLWQQQQQQQLPRTTWASLDGYVGIDGSIIKMTI